MPHHLTAIIYAYHFDLMILHGIPLHQSLAQLHVRVPSCYLLDVSLFPNKTWLNVKLQESRKKASIISPESEIEALGGCEESNPEKLSCQLTRLTERLKRETQR